MAGRKLKNIARVKASSMLEVIISMVVIVVVFTIAMAIFSNVQRLSLSGKKLRAQSILKNELLKLEQSLKIEKESIIVGGFDVEQEVLLYKNTPDLYQINITAYDSNKVKAGEIKEIYYDGR